LERIVHGLVPLLRAGDPGAQGSLRNLLGLPWPENRFAPTATARNS
jgi:hypothetical protein